MAFPVSSVLCGGMVLFLPVVVVPVMVVPFRLGGSEWRGGVLGGFQWTITGP